MNGGCLIGVPFYSWTTKETGLGPHVVGRVLLVVQAVGARNEREMFERWCWVARTEVAYSPCYEDKVLTVLQGIPGQILNSFYFAHADELELILSCDGAIYTPGMKSTFFF